VLKGIINTLYLKNIRSGSIRVKNERIRGVWQNFWFLDAVRSRPGRVACCSREQLVAQLVVAEDLAEKALVAGEVVTEDVSEDAGR